MATLSDYKGSVSLIAGITPKSSGYPLVEAHDVQVATGDVRLDTKLANIDTRLGTSDDAASATGTSVWSRVKKLQAEVGSNSDGDTLSGKVATNIGDISTLKTNLGTRPSGHADAFSSIGTLEANVSALQSSVGTSGDTANSSGTTTWARIKAIENEIGGTGSGNSSISARISALQEFTGITGASSSTSLDSRLSTLQSTVSTATSNITTLQNSLGTSSDTGSATGTTAWSKANYAQAGVDSLTAKVGTKNDTASASADNVWARILNAEDDIDTLEAGLGKSNNAAQAPTDSNTTAWGRIKHAESEIGTLDTRAGNHDVSIASLGNNLGSSTDAASTSSSATAWARIKALEATTVPNVGITIAANASDISDRTKTYLYTGTTTTSAPIRTNNHIYYYDGSDWADAGTIGGVSLDTTLQSTGAAAQAAAVGEKIDDIKANLVSISPTQPTSPTNRIWIDSTTPQTQVQIPTMTDFSSFQSDIAGDLSDINDDIDDFKQEVNENLTEMNTSITNTETAVSELSSDIDDIQNDLESKASIDDVNGLKSAFNFPANLIDGVALISNKFVFYTNGVIMRSPICDASDYIDITGISKIVYPRLSLMSATDNSGIAFYNEQKEYISGIRCIREAETNGSVLDIASVPTGAKYVRLSLIKSDPKYLYNAVEYANSLGGKVDTVEDDIVHLNEDVTSSVNALSIISGVTLLEFQDGFIEIPNIGITASLTRTSFEQRKSAYAAVTDEKVADINVIGAGTTSAGARAWAFLDENYVVILRSEIDVTFKGTITIPPSAAWLVVNTKTDTISDYYAYIGTTNQSNILDTAMETADNVSKLVNSILDEVPVDVDNLNVTKYFIDITNNVIGSSASQPARLVAIPVEENKTINVSIPLVSTKKVAFCNAIEDQSPAYEAQEITGALNKSFTNSNYKYLVIQLFLNSDTDKDYTHYLANANISVVTAVDVTARREIENLKENTSTFFHVENILGLPILNSFDSINIVTSAYDNSSAFHDLVKIELCDNSDGYLVQTLLGDDGHGNNLYKYVTFPESMKYGANRKFGTPDYPIAGGADTDVFTVIVTTNIHGIEHGGNWVLYNLLYKILIENEDSDMIRFFKNRVKFVWVPYICASGNYENADGININRDFPTTKNETCSSREGNLVKGVIDEYGEISDLHIDIHTFETNGTYAQYFASWAFTDSEKLGKRSVVVSKSVCDRYSQKYTNIDLFKKEVVSAVNTPTTCTYYTQTVYGIPSGTIEGALSMIGSPEGTDSHTSATSYLYDIITQTICAMVD